ncbi:hypothetical protein MKQ70_02940 [Chitinophaga sedimenti]|uniref:RNA polymerase sigma factor n=1 Tax=Chitinophaga sedimenti TaxID=2033606 RepID=UPI0020035018|nr:sigma factor [Chitinophaga sedimenti]MCK7554021.1 hypothetical protein [Chitinophaga sedimenti]
MNGNLHTQEYWRQLRDGNTDALSALYQLHYVGLINYGVKLAGDRDLANDCFTAVLLELWEKRHKLPEVTNVRSYLITCLHRRMLHEIESGKGVPTAICRWPAGRNGSGRTRNIYLLLRAMMSLQKLLPGHSAS